MKVKRIDYSRLVPIGQDGGRQAKRIAIALTASTLWSVLRFLMSYLPERRVILRCLSWVPPGTLTLMDHFAALLRYTMLGFQFTAAAMILMALSHYFCHYRGCRSIYLMRRLPDGWDLWRRCLTLPALGLAGCILLSLVLLLIYFFVYRFCTPPGYYDPAEAQEGLYQLLCRLFS